MAIKTRKSLTEAADKELKSAFSLDKFKANKGLASNVKFKEQKWIPFSPALQEALSIPGITMGHNSMVRGKSNTGYERAVCTCRMNHRVKRLKVSRQSPPAFLPSLKIADLLAVPRPSQA